MSSPVLDRPGQMIDQAHAHTRRATREASPWIEALGRCGHTVIGVVYVIIGLLAAQAARGEGGTTTDQRGALNWIVEAPFGRFLMVAVVVGLAGYAVWRFVQAGYDTEHQGSSPQGLAARAGYLVIGTLYLGTALTAAKLALGWAAEHGNATQDVTAMLLAKPFGQWLVGLLGLAVLGSALFQLYLASSGSFADNLTAHAMTAEQRTWATRAGRFGYGARGIAFGIIGTFLVMAAWHAEPNEARGLGGALSALAEQPFGSWLLLIVALGLVAYGVFSLVQARFRRMVIT
jgi:hypothetical protein